MCFSMQLIEMWPGLSSGCIPLKSPLQGSILPAFPKSAFFQLFPFLNSLSPTPHWTLHLSLSYSPSRGPGWDLDFPSSLASPVRSASSTPLGSGDSQCLREEELHWDLPSTLSLG